MGNVGNIEKVMVFGILGIIIIILGIAIWGDNEREGLPYDTATAQQGGGTGDKLGVTVPPGNTGSPQAQNQPFVYVPEVKPEDLKDVPPKPPVDVTARKDAPVLIEPPKPERPKTYKVESGDSFESIAVKLFGDARYTDELMKANEDVDPRKLRVGQVLNVPLVGESAAVPAEPQAAKKEPNESAAPAAPAPATYTVKPGDTLYSITKQLYGSSRRWKEIWELNKKQLPDPQALKKGMVLQLPKN